MELGIGSWSVPWSNGVAAYAHPSQPLGAMGLLEKAVQSPWLGVSACSNRSE